MSRKPTFNRRAPRPGRKKNKLFSIRSHFSFERLEARELLAADDLLVGLADNGGGVLRYNLSADVAAQGSVSAGNHGLTSVSGMAGAPDGTFYVSNPATDQIVHYSNYGAYLGTFAGAGTGLDSSLVPGTLTFGPNGDLYAADHAGGKVAWFNTSSGTMDGSITLPSGDVPGGIAFAHNGDLIVGDLTSGAVLQYSGGTSTALIAAGTAVGTNDSGDTAGHAFLQPVSILAENNGNLLIADASSTSSKFHDQVVLYNATAKTTSQWIDLTTPEGTGSSAGDYAQPQSLLRAPDGNLLVGVSPDPNKNGAVEEYDIHTGSFVKTIASGIATPGGLAFVPSMLSDLLVGDFDGSDVLRYEATSLAAAPLASAPGGVAAGDGAAGGQSGLTETAGLAVAPDGTFYVSSYGTGQVLHFASDGTFLNVFAGPGSSPSINVIVPGSLAFGPNGDLYIPDLGLGTVSWYNTSTGTMDGSVAVSNALGAGAIPGGIAFANNGDLIVGNIADGSVTQFDGAGNGTTLIQPLSGVGNDPGFISPTQAIFVMPSSIVVEPNGNLLVADENYDSTNYHHQIVLYNASTGALSQFINLTTPVGTQTGFVGDYAQPESMTVSNSGTLLVEVSPDHANNGAIQQYNLKTGAFISTLASGIGTPAGIAYIRPSALQTTPSITWADPADITYGTAIGPTQLDATGSVPGTFSYTLADNTTPANGAVLHAGAQTLVTIFTPTDTADYTAAVSLVPITVDQATPGITWTKPADITYGTPLGATQLDATASVPGTFSYTLADGTTAASGAVLHAGTNQTLNVTFTPTDTIDYQSVTAQVQINVGQATPGIIWANPADITYGTALGATQLDATASVPGMFSYTLADGTTAANGAVLHAGNNQTLNVAFTPTDTADYKTTAAQAQINVDQATPGITWANPADIRYGTALGATQLDATASVPGTFSYTLADGTTAANGAVLHAGTKQTLDATFTPTDTTDYKTTTAQVQINVDQVTPGITWANPADITYGTALGATQLDATASVPGTFSYTLADGTTAAGGAVLHAGTNQTLNVTFTPTDKTDYTTTTAQVEINVDHATPGITWANPADITYGTPLGATQLDATASVPGTLSYTLADGTTPASGAVLHVGNNQTLNVTFTPTDTTDYTTTTAQAQINVDQATPGITWTNPADITFGTALGAAQLDAAASVPGTFSYTLADDTTPANGVVLNAGKYQTLNVTFTPTDTADYKTTTGQAQINVDQAPPGITWPDPGNITYGTPLGATQLDATASVPGTFSYTLADGTTAASGAVLHAGMNQTLNATFTPTDTTDYKTVTAQVHINVDQVTPGINWTNPTDITYGTALGATQLDATASVPGTFSYTLTDGTTPAFGAILHAGKNQTLNVTFTPTDAVDYAATAAQTQINVNQATPDINWTKPVDITYGTALGSTQLDATASVPGTFSYTLADGTTAANGATLNVGQNQTLNVAFTPTDTVDYTTTSAQTQINVDQATPGVSWANPADITYGTALGATQLDATASVPGTFSYTLADGTTAADGAILHAGKNQILHVTFTPTDTVDYATTTAQAQINVAQATPGITWTNPADITYGTALGSTQLDATASVPGTFSYTLADGTTPASGAVLHAGMAQTLNVSFTPTDTVDYTTTSAQSQINVGQATPGITWTNPTDITYGTPLGATQLDATASVPGTFSYTLADGTTPASGAILHAGTDQTLNATFAPTDSTDYATVSGQVRINVDQVTPSITWANPADIDYGTPLSATQLDATAGVPGTFSYTLADGTTSAGGAVLGVGHNQTLNAIFTPTDTTDYTTATAHVEINVDPVSVLGSPVSVNATEAATFSGAVATFTDPNPGGALGDYSATINWGDGTTADTGQVAAAAGGGFAVTGSHVYAEEGTRSVTVTITGMGDKLTTVVSSAVIADAPLSGTGTTIATGTTVSGTVASFSDPDTGDTTSDYAAAIDWGDGQTGSGAIAAGAAAGQFNVTGSHDYADNSPHTITVTVTHGADQPLVIKTIEPGQTFNLSGNFGLAEDVYVIGTGTVTVSAANGVLANDTAASPLTVAAGTVPGANGGTFSFHLDGSFTYAPPSDFPGFDDASYTATDAAGQHATATVTVLSQTGGLVWKMYEQVLHRDPDIDGLQFWINDFLKGGSPGDFAAGFFESTELLTHAISGYYEQFLGRAPDSDGLNYYINQWRTNGGPEQSEAGFFVSPEFHALAVADYGTHGTDPVDWIWGLYERILNRAPDANGLSFWQQQLVGGTSEYQVALDFFTSPEAFDNDVSGWFNEYLGRAPSATEQATYANQLLSGVTDRSIEQQITDLPEYSASPPASPPGTGVRLPDYLPATNSAKSQAATDEFFTDY